MPSPLTVVILAAGQGTRMQSSLPKVLHPLAGRPLLAHVLAQASALDPKEIIVVISKALQSHPKFQEITWPPHIRFVVQEPPQGTGHAVLMALESCRALPQNLLVLLGDVPLIREDMLTQFVKGAQQSGSALSLIAMRPPNPKGYGRVILGPSGLPEAIREDVDLSEKEQDLDLCHSGIFFLGADMISDISHIPQARGGEYYLTHLVQTAHSKDLRTGMMEAPFAELQGVNTRQQLAEAEGSIQNRLRKQVMDGGVTLMDPSSSHLSWDTKIGPDTVLYPHVVLGPGVVLEEGVTVFPFSCLSHTHARKGARIGPCAHLRGGVELGTDVKVGSFVEVKKSTLGEKTSAAHLTYIGDATLGRHVNVGAGTITCNYNGQTKHETYIDDDAFLGSNTSLIAPLKIGAKALIGAGSVITKDVPKNTLALERGEQIMKLRKNKKG